MGWFSNVWNAIREMNDDMTPEWAREIGREWGLSNNDMWLNGDPIKTSAETAIDIDIGNLTAEEAADSAAKRFSRLGKYFTSPLGVLSGASTGSGKVFS